MMYDEHMVNAAKMERRLEMDEALKAGPLGPFEPSWHKAWTAMARVWAHRPKAAAVTRRDRRHGERVVTAVQES